MTVLDHLAQVAAIILILELMVVLLVFLGVSAGLAFGFRWVNGKAEPAFKQVHKYTGKGTGYLHTGTTYAALPVIVARRYIDTAGAIAEAIRARVRLIQAARSSGPAATRPIDVEPVQEPVGARPVTSK